jgi:hypothetical protein
MSYEQAKQMLKSACESFEKAEALEKEALEASGFVLSEKYKYLYSDLIAAVTDFCNRRPMGEDEANTGEIEKKVKLIDDVVEVLKEHLYKNGGISEEMLTKLKQSKEIRSDVCHSLLLADLLM